MDSSAHSSALQRLVFRRVLPVATVLGLAGCPEPPPDPTPLDTEEALFRRPVKQKRDPDSPFRDPAREPPEGRDGEQVPEDQMATLLESARADMAAGRSSQAGVTLRQCANKTPASAQCDGELGLALLEFKNRRAEAHYYLHETAIHDDPKASADLYARVAEGARKHGLLEDSLAAIDLAIAREDTTEHRLFRARILQSLPDGRPKAADELKKIREAGEADEKMLFDEAVLRSQIEGQLEEATKLYVEYYEKTKDWPPEKLAMPRAELEMRIGDMKKALEAGGDAAKGRAPGGM